MGQWRVTLIKNHSRSNDSALSKNHSLSNNASDTEIEVSNVANEGQESQEIDYVYLNGNVNYIRIGDETDHTGWTTCQYTHSITNNYRVLYKCCLGNYTCPEPGCKFKSRPRLPRNPSKQLVKNPLPPKNPHFVIHNTTELIHVPCQVEIIVSTSRKQMTGM